MIDDHRQEILTRGLKPRNKKKPITGNNGFQGVESEIKTTKKP